MTTDFKNWFPFQLSFENKQAKLYWCDMKTSSFAFPFLSQEIEHHLYRENPSIVQTHLHVLLEKAAGLESIQPNGFIFHMSSCGSTVLSNMFRKLPKNISLGEPTILTSLLLLQNPENQRMIIDAFRAAVSFMGQKRLGVEEHYVIKFPSYATLFLPLINEAFPDVPKLFLYRDPVEVIVSNMKRPDQAWIWNETVAGVNRQTLLESSALENCTRALKAKCAAFLKYGMKNAIVAAYPQLSVKLFEKLAAHFNMRFSPDEISIMASELGYYAKMPGEKFYDDKKEKQDQASAQTRKLAEEHLADVYRELEKLKVSIEG